MGTKDTRAAHGAAAKKDMLLFEDDKLVLVTDEKHPLYDERVNLEPSEAMILNIIQYGVIEPVIVWKDPETGKTLVVDGRQRVKACREANKRIRKAGGEPHRIPAITRRADAGTSVGLMISTNEQRVRPYQEKAIVTLRALILMGKKRILAVGPVALGKMVLTAAITRMATIPMLFVAHRVELLDQCADQLAFFGLTNGIAAHDDPFALVRAHNTVENVKRELEEKDIAEAGASALVRGAIVALQWVLGDDKALKALGLS